MLPCDFKYFEKTEKEPSLLVFDSLTGDKKNIPLSDFTRRNWVKAILLKLIMDKETRYYKLILVIRSDEIFIAPADVFFSEEYDPKSGRWRILDSGFVRRDGVLAVLQMRYCDIFYDCSSDEVL